MSKALVIKSANFSANKVTTVVIGDPVPCTGISITESSVSATDLDPIELTYSVTPSDTTDAVVWTSSNSAVATVADGVITPVGLGTATITATCGSFSDTVTVTVALAASPAFALSYISAQGNNTFTANSENSQRISAYGAGAEAGTYICPRASTGTDMPVIKIPGNTQSITFAFSDKTRLVTSDDAIVWWMKDESVGSAYPTAAKLIEKGSWYDAYNNPSKTINVPEGADSFLYSFKVASVASGETAADVAEDVGITITFNATAVS